MSEFRYWDEQSQKEPLDHRLYLRHGHWIKAECETVDGDSVPIFECSVCHDSSLDNYDDMNYCPRCGAKMDEDKTADMCPIM